MVSRKCALAIKSEDGRELQEINVPYGAQLLVKDGQTVKTGIDLIKVDHHNDVIVSEKSGKITYVDLLKNFTLQESVDEETQEKIKYILEYKSDKYQPALQITGKSEEDSTQYYLPYGSYLLVENEQDVKVGDILVKMPKEASKTKDITGLPSSV